MAISMSDNKRDEHKFWNTSPTQNNLIHAIYDGEDGVREFFHIEPTYMRRTIGDLLFRDPYHKKYEFVVGDTGVYALPLGEGSFSVQRVERKMTREHKDEYKFCIVERLREYFERIKRNAGEVPYGSYRFPEFTLEKATEIAEEAFKLSFERTKRSYRM